MRGRWGAIAAPLALGCEGPQRLFAPAGPGAETLMRHGLVLIVATVVPAVVVIAIAIAAAVRRRRGDETSDTATRRRDRRIVLGATGATVVLLAALVVAAVRAGGAAVRPPGEPAFTIDVIGHQYWWEVRYPDHGDAVTANELRIPVGEVVRVRVTSADVIHSFWVPELHGKIDMVPGRTHATWLRADRAGVYRGQCAEFCGLQHAWMAFRVVAEEPEAFRRWIAGSAAPRAPPDEPVALRAEAVYARARCHDCHAVRGRFDLPEGAGSPGPDLTRLAGRAMLGAGVRPMTRDALADWILDPHRAKPGVRMPASPLPADDLDALVRWLLPAEPAP